MYRGKEASSGSAAERNAAFLRNRKYSELSDDCSSPPAAPMPLSPSQGQPVEDNDATSANPLKRANPTAPYGPEAKKPNSESSSQDNL